MASVLKCPQHAPGLSMMFMQQGRQVLKYWDPTCPKSGAKPRGAKSVLLFVAVGDRADAPVDEARYYGSFTRNPMDVTFEPCDDGRVATYYARWCSPSGESGPWSQGVSIRIAA